MVLTSIGSIVFNISIKISLYLVFPIDIGCPSSLFRLYFKIVDPVSDDHLDAFSIISVVIWIFSIFVA
jgi:hypothetical protein